VLDDHEQHERSVAGRVTIFPGNHRTLEVGAGAVRRRVKGTMVNGSRLVRAASRGFDAGRVWNVSKRALGPM
jgi:hypothetical protein